MYRDNTLIPTEATRLAALGMLAERPRRYGDLAKEVRQFASRITGPSLDILGTSIELLRYEGLVEPVDGSGMHDNALLRITEAGRTALKELLCSNVRTPVDGINRLIVALKMRHLHRLDAEARRDQIDVLIEMSETELARLRDLRADDGGEGYLRAWLDHDIGQVEARLGWFKGFRERV